MGSEGPFLPTVPVLQRCRPNLATDAAAAAAGPDVAVAAAAVAVAVVGALLPPDYGNTSQGQDLINAIISFRNLSWRIVSWITHGSAWPSRPNYSSVTLSKREAACWMAF